MKPQGRKQRIQARVELAAKAGLKDRKSKNSDRDTERSRSKSTALVVTKKVATQIEANFGAHAPRIINMLEMDNTDGAMTLLKKKLLQTSIGLLPSAEETVRESKSSRGVYQFTTLVSQIREIIGDIEADRNRDLLLDVIDNRVIRPAFMDAAHAVMMQHYELRKELEQTIKPSEVQRFNLLLKKLTTNIGVEMQAQYTKVREGLAQALKD